MRSLVLLLFFVFGGRFGQSTTPSMTYKVRIQVAASDDILVEIRAYLLSSLRSRSDVSIVESNSLDANFGLSVVCISTGAKVGPVLACSEAGVDLYPKMLSHEVPEFNIGILASHTVVVGSRQQLAEMCAGLVSSFDQDCIEKIREKLAH